MERFLTSNPEFKKQSELLLQIRKRILFKEIPSLDTYLSVFNIPMFKRLIEKDFFSNKKLKETYKEIIKTEANEVEKMIFQMISNKEIKFSDPKLKFLFAREFPNYIHLLKTDGTFELEDLLFQKIYLQGQVDDKLQYLIENLSFKKQVFCFIALHSILDHNFIKNKLLEMKTKQEEIKSKERITEEDFTQCWVLGLRSLSSAEFYAISASELLYSSYLSKLCYFRALKDCANLEKLSVSMIRLCFTNTFAIVKTYIVFLKVIELFELKYRFKLSLLYAWLRFFIIENQLDLFFDLMKNLKNSPKLDDEFDMYLTLEQYLLGNISYGDLSKVLNVYEDGNDVCDIKINDIVEKLKK